MPENIEIIRARTKDDAAVLIDRVIRAKQNNIGIILPKNSIIAASPESLKIIQQEAESIGRQLFLATENPEIKAFAKKLDISLFNPSSFQCQAKAIKRIIDILPPQSIYSEKSDPLPVLEEVEPQIYETFEKPPVSNNPDLEKNIENFYNDLVPKTFLPIPKKAFSLKGAAVLLVVVGIFSLVSVLYLLLPEANIKISAKTIPVKISIPVAVSKNASTIDLANGIIPGQYFSLSKTGHKTINLSNNQQEVISRAGGFIDIYNAYSSAPQKLIVQTRFETKDGKIFRLQNAIIVPGAKVSGAKLTPSSIRAAVLADQPGEEYNIGPSYFTIPGFKNSPKYAGFYAKSMESMASSRVVLTEETLEKSKQKLLNELIAGLENDNLNTVGGPNLKLINGASSVKIQEFNSSVPVGSIADSVNITMKIMWQAIAFNETDFKALMNYFVSHKYPDLKNFNFGDSISYPRTTKTDFKKKELFFVYNIDEVATMAIDIDNLKKELVGCNENEMRELISGKGFISSATISLWPFWVSHAPDSPGKINIIVDKN